MILTNDIEVFPHQEKTKTVSEWLELRDLKKDFYANKFQKVPKNRQYVLGVNCKKEAPNEKV